MSKQLREHQARKTALVKEARALTDLVASQDRDMTDDEVTAFEALRMEILCSPRDQAALNGEITAMRQRMRAELDRSRADAFDLKHGFGGLTDIEFFLQALVLGHAATNPALAACRDSSALVAASAQVGLLTADEAEFLREGIEVLQAESLRCHLAMRPRVVAPASALQAVRDAVGKILQDHGYIFVSRP